MNWFKNVLLKVFRSAINQLIQEALDKAVDELNEEIDSAFEDENKRATLKSGIVMLRSRVLLAVRERL